MLDRCKNWFYQTRFSKAVNRLAMSRINPNTLTFFGLIFGIIAAYLIYKHKLLIAIIFLILTGLCDLCDGWVARVANKETKFGALLDVTLDKYVEGLIGLAFAFITPALFFPGYIWVILEIFGSIIISVVSNVGIHLSNKKPFKIASRFDRGVIIFLGLILAHFFGDIYLTYTAILMVIVTHLTVISLLISYYKILKKEK